MKSAFKTSNHDKSFYSKSILTFVIILLSACSQKSGDPLPSFEDGETKSRILSFVNTVVDANNDNYVNPEDRIAVFDNDGTLWVEQPLPSQLYFDIDRIRELASTDNSLSSQLPYSAVVNMDTAAIHHFTAKDLLQIVGKAQEAADVNDFPPIVMSWIDTAIHPVMKKKYTQLVYQPMLELIAFLQKNDFKVYIVSGGSVEFMIPWAPAVYGIPKEQIIGSTFKTETHQEGEEIVVAQTSVFDMMDDKDGKVININRIIGKKPIFIAGNSDGDLPMMEYSDTENPLFHFEMYIKHDDGEREFLYNDKVLSGALIEGEKVAKDRGWTILSMKNDWKQIFPSEEK